MDYSQQQPHCSAETWNGMPSSSSFHLSVPLPQFSESHFGQGPGFGNHQIPQHQQSTVFFTSGGSDTASTSSSSRESASGGKPRVLCVICGDGASGRHYGVTSCEGCKGFFKRTVRKDLSYACRHQGNCVIDKRQRNRCQHCRYRKCAEMGMKRDAVQEERQTDKGASVGAVGGKLQQLQQTVVRTTRTNTERIETQVSSSLPSTLTDYHLSRLRSWLSGIPALNSFSLQEQHAMLHYGWTELILLEMVYHSSIDRIWLRDKESLGRAEAMHLGICDDFDAVLNLAKKLGSLSLDPMEFGALRLIVLFNPDFVILHNRIQEMETHRDRVNSSLVTHCKNVYPNDPSRSSRILFCLPSLRYLSVRLRHQSIIVPAPPFLDYSIQPPQLQYHAVPTVPLQTVGDPVYYAQ